MIKRLAVSTLAVALWSISVGCDLTTLSALPDDLGKLVTSARGIQSGDVLMDQTRQRDQLRDGTGASCPKAASVARGLGDQTRDQLRLQDGTGVNCPN